MSYFRTPACATAALLGLILAGCAAGNAQAPSPPPPPAGQTAEAQRTVPMDAAQGRRLQQMMLPLIRHMDHPIPVNQVKITLLDDPNINAANGGGGDFYVTTGLLRRASDDHLRAILAHEIAHADLGHVAKSQALATGLGIGISLLDQLFPGTGAFTPIAGQLVASGYSRTEEFEADAHGVSILRRGGYDGRALMANTLTWLKQGDNGGGGGGFFATHPPTDDRIAAVRRLP
jgi:predicted Zn-dependent protease